MFPDNVIWVDFRFSKYIRGSQIISFEQWMKARAGRAQSNHHVSSALEIVKLILDRDARNRGPNDKS
jgi:hypothetical protein